MLCYACTNSNKNQNTTHLREQLSRQPRRQGQVPVMRLRIQELDCCCPTRSPHHPVRSTERHGPATCNSHNSHQSGREGDCKLGMALPSRWRTRTTMTLWPGRLRTPSCSALWQNGRSRCPPIGRSNSGRPLPWMREDESAQAPEGPEGHPR